jgi:hypothetical protein
VKDRMLSDAFYSHLLLRHVNSMRVTLRCRNMERPVHFLCWDSPAKRLQLDSMPRLFELREMWGAEPPALTR